MGVLLLENTVDVDVLCKRLKLEYICETVNGLKMKFSSTRKAITYHLILGLALDACTLLYIKV